MICDVRDRVMAVLLPMICGSSHRGKTSPVSDQLKSHKLPKWNTVLAICPAAAGFEILFSEEITGVKCEEGRGGGGEELRR